MTLMETTLEHQLHTGSADVYAIYRLLTNDANKGRFFCGYDAHGGEILRDNYAPIYLGELKEGQQLQDIYDEFNLQHPDDYHSYSMSVGDVIAIRHRGELSAYFVDSFKFSVVPGFFGGANLTAVQEEMPAPADQIDCPMCGEIHSDSDRYCARCTILEIVLEGQMTMDALAGRLWDCCSSCCSNIISSVELLPDSLVIQCDDCPAVYTIPFSVEDILRYLRVGITAETEED